MKRCSPLESVHIRSQVVECRDFGVDVRLRGTKLGRGMSAFCHQSMLEQKSRSALLRLSAFQFLLSRKDGGL